MRKLSLSHQNFSFLGSYNKNKEPLGIVEEQWKSLLKVFIFYVQISSRKKSLQTHWFFTSRITSYQHSTKVKVEVYL